MSLLLARLSSKIGYLLPFSSENKVFSGIISPLKEPGMFSIGTRLAPADLKLS
jgi:hypothetical protein